jgi:hypothetical protein
MPDTEISNLPHAATINGAADKIPITTGGVTKYVFPDQLGSSTTDAADLTSGVVALARGGTGADLSATGGTGKVLKQKTAGGTVAVEVLDASEIATGQIALARGGTNADLSATGGTGKFLKQKTSGGAVAVEVLAASELPTTGLSIDAYTVAWGTGTDGATVTFNIATHAKWKVTLGGNRTLAVSNAGTASSFTLKLIQDGTGSRTVTWWSGIDWSGGVAPTLTTTAGRYDVFTFLTDGSGSYTGFVAGQNFG